MPALQCSRAVRGFDGLRLSSSWQGEAKNALECSENDVQVLESKMPKAFTYDHVFGSSHSQEAIFRSIGLPLLENAMNACAQNLVEKKIKEGRPLYKYSI